MFEKILEWKLTKQNGMIKGKVAYKKRTRFDRFLSTPLPMYEQFSNFMKPMLGVI